MSVVVDNWSLQDISTLLTKGFEHRNLDEIIFQGGEHFYQPISHAVIQTEALFDVITDLILQDEMLVEEKYCNDDTCPIVEAKNAGVVRAYSFLNEAEKISAPRDQIIQRICSAESLHKAHKENINGWIFNRQTQDPLLSATLWGGAGMCARSYLSEKNYTPHPLRKKLLINSGFMSPTAKPDHLTHFLNDEKVTVLKKHQGKDALYYASIKIPALPILVIQESASPQQMISIALQMRDDFKSLREWVKHFQDAISNEDTQSLISYRNQLNSIIQELQNKIDDGSLSSMPIMEVGIGIFKIAISADADNIKNQFGIRATLNQHSFDPKSQPIKKYLAMFDEKGEGTLEGVAEAFV